MIFYNPPRSPFWGDCSLELLDLASFSLNPINELKHGLDDFYGYTNQLQGLALGVAVTKKVEASKIFFQLKLMSSYGR